MPLNSAGPMTGIWLSSGIGTRSMIGGLLSTASFGESSSL